MPNRRLNGFDDWVEYDIVPRRARSESGSGTSARLAFAPDGDRFVQDVASVADAGVALPPIDEARHRARQRANRHSEIWMANEEWRVAQARRSVPYLFIASSIVALLALRGLVAVAMEAWRLLTGL